MPLQCLCRFSNEVCCGVSSSLVIPPKTQNLRDKIEKSITTENVNNLSGRGIDESTNKLGKIGCLFVLT